MKFFISIFCVFLLYNCNCKYCTDNLSFENQKIIYSDSSLITFKNDTLGVKTDTIFVFLGKISKRPYACNNGNDDKYVCHGESTIKYSNLFVLKILQFPNSFNCNNCIGIGFPYEYQEFIQTDSIQYSYKNKILQAFYIYFKQDIKDSLLYGKNISKDSLYKYNNYIYVKDSIIKLLEYSITYKDGTKRKWKLKE